MVSLLRGPIGQQLQHLSLPGITQLEYPWLMSGTEGVYSLPGNLVAHPNAELVNTDNKRNEDLVQHVLESCSSLTSLHLREGSFRNHDEAIIKGG